MKNNMVRSARVSGLETDRYPVGRALSGEIGSDPQGNSVCPITCGVATSQEAIYNDVAFVSAAAKNAANHYAKAEWHAGTPAVVDKTKMTQDGCTGTAVAGRRALENCDEARWAATCGWGFHIRRTNTALKSLYSKHARTHCRVTAFDPFRAPLLTISSLLPPLPALPLSLLSLLQPAGSHSSSTVVTRRPTTSCGDVWTAWRSCSAIRVSRPADGKAATEEDEPGRPC